MILLLTFLAAIMFLVFNGVALAVNPRKWMSIANRSIQFAWGENSWFRYTPERMTRTDLFQWRFQGAVVALLAGTVLVRVVYLQWLSRGRAAPPAPSSTPDGADGVPYIWVAFLTLWVIYGALLATKPRWTLRFFGTARHVDVSDRFLWVWRVIGAGLAIGGGYALFRSALVITGL